MRQVGEMGVTCLPALYEFAHARATVINQSHVNMHMAHATTHERWSICPIQPRSELGNGWPTAAAAGCVG